MLAIFFGTGMTVLSWVQRSTRIPGRSGLDEYLFGMAAAMTTDDLRSVLTLGTVAITVMILAWNRLKLLTFDADYAAGLGLNASRHELLLLALLVTGIVIGLQIVGVVLMITLLVAPAAAARQWTTHLGPMVTVAGFIGGISSAVGAFISASGRHLPTGPIIVALLTMVFIASLFLAPRRGLLFRRRHVD